MIIKKQAVRKTGSGSRPISRDDLITLFRWRADASELNVLSYSRRVPTYEEFIGEMERSLRNSVTLLVLNREDGEPIGFAQAYNINLESGWGFITVHTEEAYRRSAQHVEAHVALLDLVFRSLGLRKVYLELPEFGLQWINLMTGGGFVEEGRFHEHVWFDDRYWDVIRLALFKEDWPATRDRVAFLLDVGHEALEVLDNHVGSRDARSESDHE